MSDPRDKAPVLPAYSFRGRWWVWCEPCAALHCHGAGPGHRTAHCRDANSPYKKTGYTLQVARVVDALRQVRPGGAPLDGFMAATRKASPDQRYRVLKNWIPKGRRFKPAPSTPAGEFIAEIRIRDGAGRETWTVTIDLHTTDWKITVNRFGPNSPCRDRRREGRGLATLAEALFGVSTDLAARKIGEIEGGGA